MAEKFEIPEQALLHDRLEVLITDWELGRLSKKDVPEAIVMLVLLHLTENNPCG